MKRPADWFMLLACLLLLIILFLVGCTAGETLERIRADGVIRVGLDPTFPPFENGDYGVLEGIDIDLANAIGRELGVSVEFVYLGYDGLYDALLIEQCDILISALVIDQAKTKDFAYSDPYFNAGQMLIVQQKDSNVITNLADLANGIVAVETGSEGHVQALSAQNRVRGLTVATFPTPDDALWTVLQGESAAAIVDSVNARLYLQNHVGLSLAAEPITVEPYAVVGRKDDGALLAEINTILETLTQSGELEEIVGRWLAKAPEA